MNTPIMSLGAQWLVARKRGSHGWAVHRRPQQPARE